MIYINLRLHILVVVILYFHESWTQQVETNPEILIVKSIRSMEQTLSYFMNRGEKIEVSELLGLRIASGSTGF